MVKVKTSAPYCPPENISADSIRTQLQRILASPEFTATDSQQKFLKFVVLETLSGNSDDIKGFTVAPLGNLGRLEEGRHCVENPLALKPDFPSRGRILIGRFIKFKSIAESTVNGLKKCGLELD